MNSASVHCSHDVILLIGPTSAQSVSVKSLAVKTDRLRIMSGGA